jgi:anti-sigma-K factor RskA
MMEHPFDDALAAYALDALDRDEAAFVERHLATCARCRAEVATLRDTTAMLALAVPTVTPPSELRSRVLQRALNTPTMTSPRTADVPRPSVDSHPVTTGRTTPPRASSMLPWYAAAACALLAVGLGAAWSAERADRAALVAAVARGDSIVSAQARALDARDSLLAQVLGPEVETVTLAATGEAPSMRLFFDRGRGVMVLSARRLPPAAAGRTYQLWGIDRSGRAVGLGVFNTSADGAAVVSLPVVADAQFVVSAVTDEPSGGSPQPTSTPFLVGSWAGTD